MELFPIIVFCLVLLFIVVGAYVYMFLNIMPKDPREFEFRKYLGQDNRLVPYIYK